MKQIFTGKYIRGFWRMDDYFRKQDISEKANQKLLWFKYYEECKDVTKTCGFFGISRKNFYKWRKRFDPKNLKSLEDESRRPNSFRGSSFHTEDISMIRKYRERYPAYGKEKLKIIITEREGIKYSSSFIGRVIKKYNIFPKRRKIKVRKTRKKRLRFTWGIDRFKYPGHWVQIDTVVIRFCNTVIYIVCGIDVWSRIAYAKAYSRCSSKEAKDFMLRFQTVLGENIQNIQTDNGSEFHGEFDQAIKDLCKKHWWNQKKTPKMNAYVEKFNDTIQYECLSLLGLTTDTNLLNQRITVWLIEYNFYRPHQGINYKKPIDLYLTEFRLKSNLEVLPMWWTYSSTTIFSRNML
jgi:transposase InsO family protein